MNDLAPLKASGELARRSPAVLVVDDEADLRELLALTLVRLGLDVDTAESIGRARNLLSVRRYALVLTDMRLPDGSGMELVREVAQGRWADSPPIAVITAYGSPENAVAALKAGAFDYLTKPVDIENLRVLVRSALRESPERAERTGGAAESGGAALTRLVGESPAMRQLRSMIRRLAHSMAPVAIFGESGSGKELVARAIHECSARHGAPFVAVNCGAIPENLMEAEFFGYRRGAFTGADRDREGFFQAAAGGTLFLDEVADLPLAMQVKLLRAIQERRVRRLGATAEESVDVRLLSATHQDLSRRVTEGRFRQDLFYRLNVIELRSPSLRERPEDVPAIASAILDRMSARAGERRLRLSDEALLRLQRYPFPGNVRELENVLERAAALAADDELSAADLLLAPVAGEQRTTADAGDHGGGPAGSDGGDDVEVGLAEATTVATPSAPFSMDEGIPSDLSAYLDELERQAILAALLRTGHNRTAASTLLGITFRQLRYRMQRLGLR